MTRYRSALVAALACASLLAINQYAEAKAHHGGAKSSSAATAKASKVKSAAKKSTVGKSKDANKNGKSTSSKAAAVPTPPASPDSSSASTTVKVWAPGTRENGTGEAQPPSMPLAQAPALHTSEADVALVKNAIDTLRKGGASKATSVAAGISDPVARKLVEWIILRSDHNGADSARYTAFMAANPSWPSLGAFRRRAEAMLWVENAKPARVMSFFDGSSPQSAMGRLVLARALMAQGETEGAKALVRDAWRNDPIPADVEKQVLERYSDFLSRADHKARMEKRLFAGDKDSAMRAAHRLGGADLAIAQLRLALGNKGGNAKKLLDAVPEEARRDPGYLFARAYLLRHDEKIAEAAQVLLSAPTDLAQVHDGEEWWVERRIMARKLLDLGDARSAYRVVAEAAEPTKENSRVERNFMAGWIALRFLDDPAAAATHFARIQEVSSHPTSQARSHYWLGRTAEALHRRDQARAEYQAAANSSAAYYGQLARARLGLAALALAPPPATPDKRAEIERLELVRALEILYALKETALVIPLMADLGGKLDDVGALSALGELAEQQHDARGMLHLGKAALARGLPLDYYAFPAVGVPRYSPIGPGIDNAMLFAIIRQESAFNPADWSAAQAMGLMQVTPIAAKDTCKRFSCSYDVKRLKNDMPYNLQIGAAELGGVMQDYRGNYMLAFAAYNAGRGRVQEWIARFGDPRDPTVDPVDWVERIPFMETRNYVQRVMENMQVYRTRFGAAPLTIETDLRRGASTAAAH
ncbi:MAG: transglycosylase SLT domain-containing protein [Xanthobacteraceae bacterium]